jgi:hypothetical protein
MRLIASSLMAGLIAFSAVAPAFADQRGRGHDRGMTVAVVMTVTERPRLSRWLPRCPPG